MVVVVLMNGHRIELAEGVAVERRGEHHKGVAVFDLYGKELYVTERPVIAVFVNDRKM